jgi:DNA primase small subunit
MDQVSPEVMLTFYRRLYPFKSIFHWLNHDHTPDDLFLKREIAFNLPGDVIIRYNSFNDHDEFKKQVCKLNPTRFEIGPVYTSRVRFFLFPTRHAHISLASRQEDRAAGLLESDASRTRV